MSKCEQRWWRSGLCGYAWFVVAATLILISVGGHVTTKGAGLAVPDWPLSFGEVNPPGWWEMPHVRLEHGHRLIGALIGLLTLGLAVWTFLVQRDRFARALVLWAVVGVVVQGILGGLRVTLVSTDLAIIHGVLGQLFLVLLAACAMRLRWITFRAEPLAFGASSANGRVKAPAVAMGLCIALPIVVFGQLIVAAVMRHKQAGLAIPDFPLSLGRLVPPFVSFEVGINFAHRVLAFAIALMVVGGLATGALRFAATRGVIFALALLVALQIALGAGIVWTGRDPALTTLHVVNGAAVLLCSFALGVRAWLFSRVKSRGEVEIVEEREALALR